MTCNKCGILFESLIFKTVNYFIRLCPPNTATSNFVNYLIGLRPPLYLDVGTLLLQALFHLVPLLLQASSLHFSVFLKYNFFTLL